jgi:subfamily B ATP-binding cassette protein HlyB/CyaB
MVESAVQERSETVAPAPAAAVDSGLLGLALIAGYYRIAADPAQIKHQLALIGRFAVCDDLVRGANLLGRASCEASRHRGSARFPTRR